jgi:RNA polymerase sigma factor (sigma-70 family)
MRVLVKLRNFRGAADTTQPEGVFKSWLRTTARRIAIDLVKRREPANGHQLELDKKAVDWKSPSSHARMSEEHQIIAELIGSLSDETTVQILQLRYFEGLVFTEIANRIGLTLDQVRHRHSAAIDHLRFHLS